VSSGTGPGTITPDGCAVDLYAMMPPGSDPDIVHAAITPGAPVLELGCGAGRMTGPLVALGHPVTAVDESAEMLARVQGAERVRSRIQDLRLGREFDAVLLASHFINAPDPERRAFLAACRRHVAPSGSVIIQQHQPGWFAAAAPQETTAGGITFRLRDISRPGPDLLSATVEYQAGERVWTQSFTAAAVAHRLAEILGEAGLSLAAYLTSDQCWLRAVPR
jgi:2-polyprenyl-3-methyl-5-hydroxy-6-metoxy-1,4-benzoquinol methylase